jgi:PAS domain S-box-containing protein
MAEVTSQASGRALQAAGIPGLDEMTAAHQSSPEERILVLLPSRRDASMCQEVLGQARLGVTLCADLHQLCREFESGGAAAIVLTEAVLLSSQSEEFLGVLASQPHWSDIPVVVLAEAGVRSPVAAPVLERIDNIVLLPRPVQVNALLTAARSALRARRRQYQMREYLAEQKGAGQALRKSDQQAHLAVETAALGTYERDLATNQITMNAVCRDILGLGHDLPAPDIAPQSLYPEDAERILAAVARAFDPALREVCAGEFRILRPDGSIRWVSGRGRVFFDESLQPPRPLKFIGVLLDITERKKAEELLQRRNQHLQLLHQAAADLLLGQPPADLLTGLHCQLAASFDIDVFMLYQARIPGGRLHLQACGGISEREKEKLETLRYGRAICARPAEALQPIIATHLQTVVAPNRRFVRKLGFHSYLYYPLLLNGRLQGTLAFASRQRKEYDAVDLEFFHTIAHTIAEAMQRRRLESEIQDHAASLEQVVAERTARLQEMVAELEHFFYTITHDMRAPLRAMRGLAGVLVKECGSCLQGQRLEFLQRIADAADRMDRLITDSLQYSLLVRGQFELEPVDADALLRQILASYPQFQPPHAHVAIENHLPTVLANQAGLTQCFSNLLGNAVKFVQPGQIPEVLVRAEEARPYEPATDLTRGPLHQKSTSGLSAWHIPAETVFSTSPCWPPSRAVRIWFEDKGIGIEKQYHDRIWVMFQRLNKTYAGTGIGLALVRKAVERMGGRVGLESDPGHGSRFWVELQIADTCPDIGLHE